MEVSGGQGGVSLHMWGTGVFLQREGEGGVGGRGGNGVVRAGRGHQFLLKGHLFHD